VKPPKKKLAKPLSNSVEKNIKPKLIPLFKATIKNIEIKPVIIAKFLLKWNDTPKNIK
jgi:hypothetical protein